MLFMLSDTEERILIRQTVDTWIRVGITPSNVLLGIAEAFNDPQPLIDAGYEVFSKDLEKIQDGLISLAKEAESKYI